MVNKTLNHLMNKTFQFATESIYFLLVNVTFLAELLTLGTKLSNCCNIIIISSSSRSSGKIQSSDII